MRSPNAGVFAALADEVLFNEAFIEYGAVTWPGEIDIAPDAMHAEIKKKWRMSRFAGMTSGSGLCLNIKRKYQHEHYD